MGGLMSVTGEPDDPKKEIGGPTKVGVAVTDLFTGLYASNAIQAALIERQNSGLGQYIDLALLDVQAATLANQASNYLVGGLVPERLGNAHPNIVPYQAFSTSDGHIIIAVGNDQQFSRLCDALQRSDLANDERFITNGARVNNRKHLCDVIQQNLKQHGSAHWLEKLKQCSVPCGPINTIDQVFKDPQVLARGMVISASESRSGKVSMVGNPIKYGRSISEGSLAPQQLGESTDQVLTDYLKYSSTRISTLRNKSII
jgi:crotonobetainyl-CoA:carnitine CoA-transferase CaiB-like acyl-CoA transferase